MSTPPMLRPSYEERTLGKVAKAHSPHSASSDSTSLGTDSDSDDHASFGTDHASLTQEEKSEQEWRTTVMLRNLPNNYTRDMLLQHIDEKNYVGLYDFFYLPMDFKSQACLGYAFINLHSPEDACALMADFDGFSNWLIPTRKRCFVSWSHPHQGFQSNIERYKNSPVMHKDVPDAYKPCVFDGQGSRTSFPTATRRVRCPRVRTPTIFDGAQHSRRAVGHHELGKKGCYELAAALSVNPCQKKMA